MTAAELSEIARHDAQSNGTNWRLRMGRLGKSGPNETRLVPRQGPHAPAGHGLRPAHRRKLALPTPSDDSERSIRAENREMKKRRPVSQGGVFS